MARGQTDEAKIILQAGIQLRQRRLQLPLRHSETRFGLSDIGAGQVTHLEPVAGSLEVRLEDSDIAAVEFDNRSIPHDVHVDRDDRREDTGLCEADRKSKAMNSS